MMRTPVSDNAVIEVSGDIGFEYWRDSFAIEVLAEMVERCIENGTGLLSGRYRFHVPAA